MRGWRPCKLTIPSSCSHCYTKLYMYKKYNEPTLILFLGIPAFERGMHRDVTIKSKLPANFMSWQRAYHSLKMSGKTKTRENFEGAVVKKKLSWLIKKPAQLFLSYIPEGVKGIRLKVTFDLIQHTFLETDSKSAICQKSLWALSQVLFICTVFKPSVLMANPLSCSFWPHLFSPSSYCLSLTMFPHHSFSVFPQEPCSCNTRHKDSPKHSHQFGS